MTTAALTDWYGRVYIFGSHNRLRLFHSLVPGSEILTITDIPEEITEDYVIVNNSAIKKLVNDQEFLITKTKLIEYYSLWNNIINKLNFIYERDSSPFLFDKIDSNLITLLQESKNRCRQILENSWKEDNPFQAKIEISRELETNFLL